MVDIVVRDVPQQLVLTERGHMRADALPGWIGEALGRQHGVVADAGDPVGASFVIYHGPVTERVAGPVEACTVVSTATAAASGLESRVEPAHREAYLRITKAEVEYPRILDAYAAVEQWVAERGEIVVGSPREVYFGDWAAAGQDDPVVDVAYPIV